jgi:S1-C subfamily serine protease
VVRGSRNVAVKFTGSEPVAAEVVRASEATDLAILKVRAPTPHFLSLAPARSAKLGMAVFTIGFPNPELLGVAPKYTDGAVSALSGYGDEATLLQTTVPVQPGNSGGPLVNEHGQVVGVMIARAAELPFLRATGTLPQNVNFATKIENLTPLLRETPTAQPKAGSRQEAVERAERAVCIVLAEQTQ